MFVSSSAFNTQIADPIIGGTYLTLLNTISNLGGTWPRFFVLEGVDYFTKANCILSEPTGIGIFIMKSLMQPIRAIPSLKKCNALQPVAHVINTLTDIISSILYV
jgi:hypothetical protein